ncbi:MAG: gfo/Idh/MocA family oxidoreductase [Chitinophagia bacterium]|nr:gfo/Idh/MocA family oxidoreductase [Chitinophagia bacterium]
MADSIRWGIIGCGNVTEVKSGPAFGLVSDSHLVAVMRRDAEKAADYARRHHVSKWFSDAEELINDPEVNAIYIATPPAFHEIYTLSALQAGKPVYVEKPMSISLDSCKRMEQASVSTGVPLTIAHYRRALPKFLAIQQMLAEKKIGEIATVKISMHLPDQSAALANPAENWRVLPALSGGGIFYDLAPHQIDLLIFLFGEAKHFSGLSYNRAKLYDAEDVVAGVASFDRGILFSGIWCFTSSEACKEDVIEINGTKGKIAFSVFGNEVNVVTDQSSEHLMFTPPAHIQQPMIEKVTQFFLGKGPNPCSAAEAIRSFAMMEAFVYGTMLKN